MNKEKFVIFTTDGNFFEFVPEAEADTAREAIDKYLKLTRENKFGNYHIMCPDGQIRTCADLIETYINPPKQLHEKISGDTEIWEFDGVTSAQVYFGWLTNLEIADVRWNITDDSRKTADITGGWPRFITLDEIAAQFPNEVLTVIIDHPLNGEIYSYGSMDKAWRRIGITGGYA